MAFRSNAVAAVVARFLSRLRFPWLFAILLVLLAVDFAVPDPVPMLDEILLAMGTLLVANLRKPSEAGEE